MYTCKFETERLEDPLIPRLRGEGYIMPRCSTQNRYCMKCKTHNTSIEYIKYGKGTEMDNHCNATARKRATKILDMICRNQLRKIS
jgi:hypothetical protein